MKVDVIGLQLERDNGVRYTGSVWG
jgi:hypothetical protein